MDRGALLLGSKRSLHAFALLGPISLLPRCLPLQVLIQVSSDTEQGESIDTECGHCGCEGGERRRSRVSKKVRDKGGLYQDGAAATRE